MYGLNFFLNVKETSLKKFGEDILETYIRAGRLSASVQSSITKGISKAIVESLKTQLKVDVKGFSRVGFAFGNLWKSIMATGYLDGIQQDDNMIEHGFEFEIDMLPYGEALSEGQSPTYIPIENLIKWVRQKGIRQGWEYRYGQKKSYDTVAYTVQKSIARNGREALLPDWNDFKKNNDLKKEFNTRMKTRKGYYQKLIREDFQKNLNKNGGR